jgi:aminoglycoside phosphotransferase
MVEGSTVIPQLQLPGHITVDSIEIATGGEHNECYRCRGRISGISSTFYIKVYKTPEINLPIERDILPRILAHGIAVPEVLFEQHAERSYLGFSEIPGCILQDYIDPRRPHYRKSEVYHYLDLYGATLARVHALPLTTKPMTRTGLYQLSDTQREYLHTMPEIVRWLAEHSPQERDLVFVHGDLHTAHLYFSDRRVTGVIDWESAGAGWREFDLAWTLRARMAFLNTAEERQAILNGYARFGAWNETSLRVCEILVYLHFAFWSRGTGTGYEVFALERAKALCS